MLLNNTKFIVKSLIIKDQKEESTFKISEDLETGKHIETNGSIVSIVLQDNLGLERFLVTMSEGVATIKMRGLEKGEEKINNYLFQKQWLPGTNGYVTILASDILDVDDPTKTKNIETNLNFNGKIKFNSFTLPKYETAEKRDEKQKDPKDGDKCFISGIGEQYYSGGEWKTLGISTPTPNASTELAGSIQIAKDSDIDKGIDIGSTGAHLMIKQSKIMGFINNLIPKGQITIFAGDVAPKGYLICDGTAISRFSYVDLYNVIHTKYGAGDGFSTFNLPNLKGKVVVGLNRAETEFNTIGKTGGTKTHILDINEIPSHNHSLPLTDYGQTLSGGSGPDAYYGVGTRVTGDNGGGQAHNNLQPYFTLNYIIKY